MKNKEAAAQKREVPESSLFFCLKYQNATLDGIMDKYYIKRRFKVLDKYNEMVQELKELLQSEYRRGFQDGRIQKGGE